MANYFSIDDILADEEVVPATFVSDAHRLGYLDPGSMEADVKAGSKTDLPLWLARELHRKEHIVVHQPKSYGSQFKRLLAADPTVVPLPFLYYYVAALRVSRLTNDKEMQDVILAAFQLRLRLILDKSYNWRETDFSYFTRMLSHGEKRLFALGQDASIGYDKWKDRLDNKLEMSGTVEAFARPAKRQRPASSR
eukprot:TRINITY_DN6115_c0_g1_i1.p1 TRINITY_DN6115_c0_g1~~TRINITY_DN6115_c0_g1_i1.p1  ORF type:complete len:194 (+),score=43.08 TRINITY_DN6115_c0_g1_i1:270-851(+)